MNIDKIYQDSDFSNAAIQSGCWLVFLGYQNGISGTVVLRYKDSFGNFGNIVSSSGENQYTLPAATSSQLGGVKIGGNLTVSADGTVSAVDTTYSAVTAISAGLMTPEDKNKLDSLVNYEKNKGHFSTAKALQTAHPTASAGDYATVDETDTVWLWDSDSTEWKNSGGATSVSTAVNTSVADAGNHFTSTNVEECLAELAESINATRISFSETLTEIATDLSEI